MPRRRHRRRSHLSIPHFRIQYVSMIHEDDARKYALSIPHFRIPLVMMLESIQKIFQFLILGYSSQIVLVPPGWSLTFNSSF